MKRKLISVVLAAAMLPVTAAMPTTAGVAAAEAKVPQYQEKQRLMEDLGRGLIASYRAVDNRNVMSGEGGVYLSWRLLGTESLTNQAFDIYRSTNGTTFTKIHTTGAHDATNYIDTTGTTSYSYKVVKAGASQSEVAAEKAVKPFTSYGAKGSEVGNGNSEINSYTYVDIPISRPDPSRKVGGGESLYYSTDDREGGANDASVGDLDGDGEYEIVLKWDPYDSKDSASNGYTGRVYIDGYEIDPDNDGYMWRIDLGQNVTAGAHYTQFIVYDFDGDGKSEIAMTTAPGTIDGTGHYVSEVGDTDEIRNVDNTAVFLSGCGKNVGPEYYTIFDGETGAALYTTDAIPLGANENGSEWGDSKANRAYRYLAGVAYLDGVHPSYIACRGYYNKAVIRAYSWDGNEMYLEWEHNASSASSDNMYGQGNHNLSIADVDNDGFDEIVYGSAVLDHDGSKAIGNTGHGHGDALHVNDFNNDGIQEVFSVKEDKPQYGANFRVAATGQSIWTKSASGDTGRGVMDNIDDEYAKEHPDTGLALAWSSSHANAFDLAGNEVAAKPSARSRSMCNFLVFRDGDLGRELLDDTIVAKYHADTGVTRRFYSGDGYSLTGSSANNYTKYTPCLSADIWGDWREEIIMAVNKASATEQAYLRIFTSTIPTDYRLTTLMHDAQYRCAIAWQNVGYNQPPHTSYYVGSAALATDGNMGTIQGSSKRISITVEFNYDEDKCYVTMLGCDDAWEETGRAERQFDLNGTSFGEFKFFTEVNGSGTITASPSLSNVSYIRTELQGGDMGDDVQPTLTPTEVPVYNLSNEFDEGERMSVSVNGTLVEFTTASNANNTRGTAYCDLSEYIDGESRYTIEYDSMLPSSSRARIALCDISQRPADSNKNGYNTTGVAFVQGVVGVSSYTINENKDAYNIADARDQYVHTKITVNALAKTYDFEITDNSGKVLASSNNVSYLDSNLEAPNGIEMLNTINDNKTYINNLDITSYIYPGPDQTLPPTAEPKPTVGPTSTSSPTQPPTEAPSQAPTPSPTPVAIVNTTTAFEAKERMTVSVEGNEITFTAASNANNGRGTAYCDLSEYIDGYDEYIVEYDSYLTSGSRARVAFCDISQRPGTSNKNGYDKVGVAFVQGVVDGNSYAVNEDKSLYGIPAARDQYVHTKLTVNAAAKTIDFVITDSTGAVLTQQEGISYLDTGLESPNGIELLDIVNNSETKIKDLKVTVYKEYEEPTDPPEENPTDPPEENPTDPPATYETYGESGIAIIAVYNEDGTLKSLTTQTVEAGDPVIKSENANEKVFAWDSLDGMKPILIKVEAATAAPTALPTQSPTAAPTAMPTEPPTAAPTAAPGATIDPDVTYGEVFSDSESFLMADAPETNKWIVSSDGTLGSTATENTDDVAGNTTSKLKLENKAVQYVLDDAITSGCFRLQYDFLVMKDGQTYGRYFRTYLDNGLVNVKYYDHGDQYNESLDISSATPVIDCDGCFTEGRARELKQIKFMRTASGVLYYDNIKLEKEIAE